MSDGFAGSPTEEHTEFIFLDIEYCRIGLASQSIALENASSIEESWHSSKENNGVCHRLGSVNDLVKDSSEEEATFAIDRPEGR